MPTGGLEGVMGVPRPEEAACGPAKLCNAKFPPAGPALKSTMIQGIPVTAGPVAAMNPARSAPGIPGPRPARPAYAAWAGGRDARIAGPAAAH